MLELALALPPLLACLPPQASSSSLRLLKRAQKHIAHRHYEEAVTDLRRAISSGRGRLYACTLHIADLESSASELAARYAARRNRPLPSPPNA